MYRYSETMHMLDKNNSKNESRTSRPKQLSLTQFFQKRVTDLLAEPWQILQVLDTNVPGELSLWVLLKDQSMHRICISIHRRFYINVNSAIANTNGGFSVGAAFEKGMKRKNLHPPRSRVLHNMYQYTLPESVFIENLDVMSEFFSRPEVEGVYETKVPFEMRALLALGSVANVKRSSLTSVAKRNTNSGNISLTEINLTDMERSSSSDEKEYLSDFKFKNVFLFISMCGNRGLIGVYFVDDNEAFIIVINPVKRYIVPPVLGSLQKLSTDINFSIEHNENFLNAYSSVSERLNNYRVRCNGPVILLTQTPLSRHVLGSCISALYEYPFVNVAYNDNDSNYSALGWEAEAVNVCHQRFIDSSLWLTQQLALSRFGCIPLGNIEEDFAVHICDVLFSRVLQENNYLLWVSDSNRPDLGGNEEEDNMFAAEIINPEVSQSNNYRTVSIELELVGLAVCAILEADIITEIEGGAIVGTMTFSDNTNESSKPHPGGLRLSSSFDHNDVSKQFVLLKKIVTYWAKIVARVNKTNEDYSSCAELLLSHVYRWISSPFSKLYDPALQHFVHSLMKKLFLQLLQEFRSMGATIVYANYNRLIINTNKDTYQEAQTYIDVVLKAVTNKKIFAWIDITPTRFWDILLFMDRHNYGGIPFSDGNDDVDEQKIISNWNVEEYLPTSIQKHFVIVISDFILHVAKLKAKDMVDSQEIISGSDGISENDADDNHALLDSQLMQRLFGILKDIQRTLSSDHSSDQSSSVFPVLAGSHLRLQNPALEFVKMVFHIIGLDKTLVDPVQRLKRSALKLLGVHPFSPEAKFTNPCLSFILADVICSYCNSCRDLDLLRDPYLVQSRFCCSFCHQPYNKAHIENSLVEILRRKLFVYQLQDLRCNKCNTVKAENISLTCTSCGSGSYSCIQSPEDFKKDVKIFLNISKYYNFSWLHEVVQYTIDPCGLKDEE